MPVGRLRLPRGDGAATSATASSTPHPRSSPSAATTRPTVDHIVAAARIGVGTFYALLREQGGLLPARLRPDRRGGPASRSPPHCPPTHPGPSRPAPPCGYCSAIAAAPLDARLAFVEVQTAGPVALARHEADARRFIAASAPGRESSPLGGELPATLEDGDVGGIAWLLHQRSSSARSTNIESALARLRRNPGRALLRRVPRPDASGHCGPRRSRHLCRLRPGSHSRLSAGAPARSARVAWTLMPGARFSRR